MISFKKLKIERERQGITQKQLAYDCDICASYLSDIEKGKKMPSLYILEKIVIRLGKSMKFIMYEDLY